MKSPFFFLPLWLESNIAVDCECCENRLCVEFRCHSVLIHWAWTKGSLYMYGCGLTVTFFEAVFADWLFSCVIILRFFIKDEVGKLCGKAKGWLNPQSAAYDIALILSSFTIKKIYILLFSSSHGENGGRASRVFPFHDDQPVDGRQMNAGSLMGW